MLDLSLIVSFLIAEAPIEVLAFLQLLAIRMWLRSKVQPLIENWSTPEGRITTWKEAAHGVMRAMQERAGSAKGVQTRQENASLLELAKGGAPMALAALPGKIELPYVGKVSIGEAMQIFQTLKGLVSGGGQRFDMQQFTAGSTNEAGYPQ